MSAQPVATIQETSSLIQSHFIKNIETHQHQNHEFN